MHLLAPRVGLTPKAGNRPSECEDALRVVYSSALGKTPARGARIALSDGASEAAFAKLWARILVGKFVECPPTGFGADGEALKEWLDTCQVAWHRSVRWERIPWHGEEKARAGSLATLLGLCFYRPPDGGRELLWTATVIGDSCLFLVRNNVLIVSSPLSAPEEFNNAPFLLCSNPAGNAQVWDKVITMNDCCHSGDLFILASDALSAWFLEKHRAGEEPWKILMALNAGEWEEWVSNQRQGGSMRNDDTAMVLIEVR